MDLNCTLLIYMYMYVHIQTLVLFFNCYNEYNLLTGLSMMVEFINKTTSVEVEMFFNLCEIWGGSSCFLPFDSDTFQKVQDNSEKVWRFHRFSLVYEYYERPALFPPLIILNHMYRAIRWLIVRCSKCCNDGIHTRNSFSKSWLCLKAKHDL